MSEKKKKAEQKEWDLNWIEDFKIESGYLKLCYEYRAFVNCMKNAFLQTGFSKILNVSVDQENLLNICFKKRDWGLETLSQVFETPGQAFEGLREN